MRERRDRSTWEGHTVRVAAAHRWLTVLVALLLLLAVLGAALAGAGARRPGRRRDRQERYGDVLAAANAEATAFVNLRYDRAAEGIDAVAAGATGDFRDALRALVRAGSPRPCSASGRR